MNELTNERSSLQTFFLGPDDVISLPQTLQWFSISSGVKATVLTSSLQSSYLTWLLSFSWERGWNVPALGSRSVSSSWDPLP